ncbi:PREDICTED: uncharacterized protein LOC109153577 [Ipomoea nil]|uniref:uncharacterized protein LOC109153577 n=1 Tax=Ipomoea nil TaxID=35883 RepID=UPI000900F2FA|nr:PREDICTED: uncharacterized protein LOC109153577 [Ipomoea nil]
MADRSVYSSERTISNASAASSASSIVSLSTSHHFMITKLTYKNFLLCRTQVIPFLHGHDLMGFVDGTNPSLSVLLPAGADALPRSNPAYAVWMRQDQALLSMLISSPSDEVMPLAAGRRTSRALWEAIVIVEELTLAGRTVTLDDQNLFIFRGLRQEFRTLTASLAIRGQPVTLQELADFLGNHEFISSRDYSSAPTGLVVQRGGGSKGRGGQTCGGQRGGGGNSGFNRGGGGRQQGGCGRGGRGRGCNCGGNQVQCQICRWTGHEVVACYNRYDPPPQANLTYPNNSDVGGFQTWIPDTGVTNHVTLDIAALTTS